MLYNMPPHHGTTWLVIEDDSKFFYRVESGDCAELVVNGPLEISLSLTEAGMRRCAETAAEALAAMHTTGAQD